MKRIGTKIIAIAALTFVGMSAVLANTGEDRWYIAGTGALVFKNENEFLDQKKNGGEYKQKLGWGTSVAIGRTMGCWRAELEAAYRRNKLKDFALIEDGVNLSKSADATLKKKSTDAAAGLLKGDAYTRDLALMANLYYDIPVCNCFSIYLGAGAGVSFNEFAVKEQFTDATGKVTYSDHQFDSIKNTLFAWQVMTGVAYDLTPNWTLTLGYRLFATTKPKFQNENMTVKARKIPLSHSVELGLRYKF